MIVVAFLAVAAGLAGTELQGFISEQVQKIVQSGGGTAAAPPGVPSLPGVDAESGGSGGSGAPTPSVIPRGDDSPSEPELPGGLDDPPTENAAEVFEDILDELNEDDDLGVSEGELNEIAEYLASLTPEELNWVLANLSDEELIRLFHNVHSDEFFALDWSDEQRDAFYETLAALDPAVREEIFGNEDVLAGLQESLDDDEYLEFLIAIEADSDSALPDDAAEATEYLDGLSEDEVNWVLGNLSDDELIALVDNVHDLDDGEIADFYEALDELDPETQAEIYNDEDVLDALRDSLDSDDYLDLLIALETDHSDGDLPSGAEADQFIRDAFPEEWLEGPIADGVQAEGNVAIINDEDYEAVCEHFNKETCTSRGLAEKAKPNRKFVHEERGNAGTVIHEALHTYNNGNDISNASVGLSEGMTEYFTIQVLETLPDGEAVIGERATTYADVTGVVGVLVDLIGEDAVADAYFNDDLEGLEDAYIDATGRDSDDFDDFLEAIDEGYPDDDKIDEALDLLEPVSE